MRHWMVLATALAFGLGATPAAAQTFDFGAHAGVSLPTGDYADAANTGFLGGLDLWYPLGMVAPGLSWYTSADAIGHDAEAEEGGFFYVPLMTGVQFDVPVGPAAVFVNGQLGVILNSAPALDSGTSDVVLNADPELGTEFAFNVGGGLQITDRMYAGLKYYPLGTVDFRFEGDGTEPVDVSFLDLYLGFGVR